MAGQTEEFPFSIQELSAFLAVCETGSITAAARRLGVTQPAVSIALSELEARLGTELVDRGVRPVALKPGGVLLRQRASALLNEARQIAPMLRDVTRGRLPLLRVGLIDSLARALSGALALEASDIAEEVGIHSGLTASHAAALLTRNLDVMIGLDDLADVADLERWPILAEPYVLALSPGMAPPADVAELEALAKSARFVRYSSRSSTGVEIERHLRRLGLDVPRWLEFDTPYGVTSSMAQGGSFAVTTPLCLIESAVDPSEVVCAPLPGPEFGRRVTLVAHKALARHVGRRIAEVARRELADKAVSRLDAYLGGLSSSVRIGG